MRYIIVIFLMLGSLTYSQETVTKKLGDFHTLKVFNGLKVEVEKAATALTQEKLEFPALLNMHDRAVTHEGILTAQEIAELKAKHRRLPQRHPGYRCE